MGITDTTKVHLETVIEFIRTTMKGYSFQISREQYNYLLPVFGNCGSQKLLMRVDRKVEKFYFIGSNEDYRDMLIRCRYLR